MAVVGQNQYHTNSPRDNAVAVAGTNLRQTWNVQMMMDKQHQ